MTVDLSRLDVPAAVVETQLNVQTLAAARARTHSPSDQLPYALDAWLVEHHEAPVSTEADYPGWTPSPSTPMEATP